MHRRIVPTLVLLLALVVVGTAFPTTAIHASNPPTPWWAWHLKVDFPNKAPRVLYTTYSAVGSPATVTSWNQTDITARCTVQGNLSYDAAGYALFDGASFIRCQLPVKPAVTSCNKGGFWAAADVRLPTKSSNNPIFTASNNNFWLSLPGNGTTSQTQLKLAGQLYQSPGWSIGSASGSRQVLMGANGSDMVAVTNFFNGLGFNWLSFMGSWQGFYQMLPANKMGHMVQAPASTAQLGLTGNLWADSQYIYIGHNPHTGHYFEGSLRTGEIDPPGCSSGG
ncbi:MAG: hypothetical protein MUD01_01725 [Chloroflexaceae bacterium]|jgi:hypothetical protein|nr:hypothetical protein [Chloroflexaceae bacterium]